VALDASLSDLFAFAVNFRIVWMGKPARQEGSLATSSSFARLLRLCGEFSELWIKVVSLTGAAGTP
jgi:hypothetical protein